MIRPFINTTINGVVWYQGERNALINPTKYHCTFPAMISDWREKWFEGTWRGTQESFPFGFVQVRSHVINGFETSYCYKSLQRDWDYIICTNDNS